MSKDSWELHSGDRITDELTVLRSLGGGNAYEVFHAFDEVTYGPVVVKLVRPAQVSDESTLRGLRREVTMLREANHPAVVRGLRSVVDGDRPHLVLEHVEGPRLSTLVRRYGAVEPAQYLPLGIEVASALHFLRGLGITHLDVKPSNVIMGAPAKLIDFSVARTADAAARLSYPIGTDAYMAPEQADPRRHGPPTVASDVWGLGATLYEAVAGTKAFPVGDPDDDDEAGRFPQLVGSPAPLPERVPDEVAKVVLSALERRPENRPTPAEVVDALEPVLAHQPRGRLGGFKVALTARGQR